VPTRCLAWARVDSASLRRARAASTSGCATSERRRFSRPVISSSVWRTFSRALSASCRVAACFATRRSRDSCVLRCWSRSNCARARLFSISVNSAGLPPAVSAARLARASATLASAASTSARRDGSEIVQIMEFLATVWPSSTATPVTIPPVSARTGCHSEGSTLPLVARVLISVCRLTGTKLTAGGSLFRSTPQRMMPAMAARSSTSRSFFTLSSYYRDGERRTAIVRSTVAADFLGRGTFSRRRAFSLSRKSRRSTT